jgi:hypothetical protein
VNKHRNPTNLNIYADHNNVSHHHHRPQAGRDRLEALVRSDEQAFDFTRIAPIPEALKVLESYNWRLQNWNTKWNALNCSVESTPETLIYLIDTAWACPKPVLEKLAEIFPTLCFHIEVGGEIDESECYSFTINATTPDA